MIMLLNFRTIALSLVGCWLAAATAFAQTDDVHVSRIWNESPHNAFTDLVHWNGKYYCTFRTGTGHVPGVRGQDGKIQVIESIDGKQWHSIAHLALEGIDLRDPKLSVTPDGRLMLLMGGSNYDGTRLVDRKTRVAFLGPGKHTFSRIETVVIDPDVATGNDWLWRVTWHQGTGYGVIYQSRNGPDQWGLHLVKTTDGIHYRKVTTFQLPGRPNESTVRFTHDGQMKIVVRNEQHPPGHGHLGTSSAPFTDFTWSTIEQRLGGPDLIQLPTGRWILGTREYGQPTRTVIGSLTDAGHFKKRVEFPSSGDTSYPGMIVVGNQLWVSYYSSHEGKSSIYLARVPLERLAEKAGPSPDQNSSGNEEPVKP